MASCILPGPPLWKAFDGNMTGMDIFEDERMVSRADLAAWLRQLAAQLESEGRIFYGAGGSVAVAEQVQCELEIESSKGGTELSVEIEFSWSVPKAPTSAAGGDEAEEEKEAEEEEGGKAEAKASTAEE